MNCCKPNKYIQNVLPIIRNLNIEENKRKIIIGRFLDEVMLYDRKARITETFYMIFNLVITIGSVVLPALLSIQNVNFSDDEEVDESYRDKIYWLSWSISLLISICNGLIQLLSLNKQYSSYILVREKLIAEGWKYFELCEDYKGKDHKQNFTKFCEEIENIKKSQTEREIVFLNPRPNNNSNRNPNGGGTNGEGTNGDGTNGEGTNGEGTTGDGTNGEGTNGDGTNGDGTNTIRANPNNQGLSLISETSTDDIIENDRNIELRQRRSLPNPPLGDNLNQIVAI